MASLFILRPVYLYCGIYLFLGEETTADSPDLKASLEEELQLVQCMLDKTSLSQEEKDNFLVKLGKVHSKRDEQFNQMVRINSTLRKVSGQFQGKLQMH